MVSQKKKLQTFFLIFTFETEHYKLYKKLLKNFFLINCKKKSYIDKLCKLHVLETTVKVKFTEKDL